jgi:serine/threonine protein kinase
MASGVPTRYGRYEVIGPLASGGMADLYLARARGLHGFETLAVVKRIRPHLAADPEFVQLFLDEARLAAQLRHPNVVHVYDAGQERGEYYFVMEYVHGRDVRALLDVAAKRKRVLGFDEALSIGLGVAGGLHHAHERFDHEGRPLGIVHRDVSPSNILCDFEGAVKLADFGIAKATQHANRGEPGSTSLRGKLSYLSPEQCLGLPLDRRSDIYALAVVLYELTTGSRPHENAATEFLAIKQTIEAPVRPPSQLRLDYPPELERIVLRGLERDRDRRYASARELQLELEAFARKEQLAVSTVTLAKLMEELFPHELHAWQAAQMLGKPLSQHLTESRTLSVNAREPTTGEWDGDDDEEKRPTSPLRVVAGAPPAGDTTAAGVSDSAPTLDGNPIQSARHRGRRLVLSTMLVAAAGAIAFVATVQHSAAPVAVSARADDSADPALDRARAAAAIDRAPPANDRSSAATDRSSVTTDRSSAAIDRSFATIDRGTNDRASLSPSRAASVPATAHSRAPDELAAPRMPMLARAASEKPAPSSRPRLRNHPLKPIAARPRPSSGWDPEAPLLPH